MKFNFKLPEIENKSFQWEEKEIQVKQYLPVVQKAALVNEIVNAVADENGYWNQLALEVWTVIHTTFAYTDIEIDDENNLNGLELYDYLITSGLWDETKNHIPKEEFDAIQIAADITLDNIYTYKNSALGVMEAIVRDYDELDLDAEKIREKIANPETLGTVKEIMSKLG